MAYLPCKNPNCRSRGKAHPNCHCYDNLSGDQIMKLGLQGKELPGTTKGLKLQGMRGGNARNARARGRRVLYAAHGGEIKSFCEIKIPHMPDCEHYAGGGAVSTPEPAPQPVHPSITLGHVAAHHGLLGILKDIGKSSIANPEKHHAALEKSKELLSSGDIDGAIEGLHGHPLTGKASRVALDPIVKRLAPSVLEKDSDPDSFRAASDYLHSSIKGHDELSSHAGSFFDPQKKQSRLNEDENKRSNLDDILKSFRQNPESMIGVGGRVGYYLPDHAAEIGALTSRASDYLNSVRPNPMQTNPLDDPLPVSENQMEKYNRQLDLANHPMLLLQHAQDGQLMPSDIHLVQLLYPQLFKSMQDKAAEALIEAKNMKKEIPHHMNFSLGMILGQPMDSSMTPAGMQAIIRANGAVDQSQDQPQEPQKKKSSGKATGVELKQINKVDAMSQTPIEARQIANKAE